jgi:hypothetical protein
MTASKTGGNEAVLDLCRCLALVQSPDETSALRNRLNAGGWKSVAAAASERMLLPALADAVQQKHLTAGIPARRSSDGSNSITLALAEGVRKHEAIRAAMLERLVELAGLLNARGMEPLLLKGARSLWTGTPAWRSMGDLDLLTPGRAAEAQAIAIAAGYAAMPGTRQPDNWHHEINLQRKDLPGWLEFHNRAAMHRADVLLSTEALLALSSQSGRHGVQARILPDHADLLHCIVHHHVSHRGDKYGAISVKGLFEFASAFAALDGEGRQLLLGLAAGHPRLVAVLDLWLAAAADRFGLPVTAPFAIHADATKHWRAMSSRTTRRGNYGGLLGELRLGLSRNRLRRATGGQTWLGRQKLRYGIVSSLLSPATRSAG